MKKSHEREYPDTVMLAISSALLTVPEGSKLSRWMMDSECTRLICDEKNYFPTFTEDEGGLQAGNNETTQSSGYEHVRAETNANGINHNVVFHDVLYVPDTIYSFDLRVAFETEAVSHYY